MKIKPYKRYKKSVSAGLSLNEYEKAILIWALNEMLENPKIYWSAMQQRGVKVQAETHLEVKGLINRIENL